MCVEGLGAGEHRAIPGSPGVPCAAPSRFVWAHSAAVPTVTKSPNTHFSEHIRVIKWHVTAVVPFDIFFFFKGRAVMIAWIILFHWHGQERCIEAEKSSAQPLSLWEGRGRLCQEGVAYLLKDFWEKQFHMCLFSGSASLSLNLLCKLWKWHYPSCLLYVIIVCTSEENELACKSISSDPTSEAWSRVSYMALWKDTS